MAPLRYGQMYTRILNVPARLPKAKGKVASGLKLYVLDHVDIEHLNIVAGLLYEHFNVIGGKFSSYFR